VCASVVDVGGVVVDVVVVVVAVVVFACVCVIDDGDVDGGYGVADGGCCAVVGVVVGGCVVGVVVGGVGVAVVALRSVLLYVVLLTLSCIDIHVW